MISWQFLTTKLLSKIGLISEKQSDNVELLVLIIDKHLTLRKSNLCRNANYKLYVLSLSNYARLILTLCLKMLYLKLEK